MTVEEGIKLVISTGIVMPAGKPRTLPGVSRGRADPAMLGCRAARPSARLSPGYAGVDADSVIAVRENLHRPQGLHRRIAVEEVEQGAQRLAARRGQGGVALEHQARVVMGDGDEIAMGGGIDEAEIRQPALARAEKLAGAAELQILLGDAEAVLGLAQDLRRARAVSPSGA